ncbi:MAG TPA: glucose-6-phosphate dehydrogenase assembly protein OpcA [Bryobacteraceae bacterium]|nr:glucose-6-phosphate dehydrogenase assembly protein OpcA [Bryobacteraceae bacterium]
MASAAALSPDRILRDLANVWVTLGKQGQPETGMGVLRACSLNLVVVAEETDEFQALGETLAALMPEHPARTIVIRYGAAPQPELSARVFAQCWMPFGQRRQICCEQIEIAASEKALDDALSLAGAVTAADLPVIAWCRSPRLMDRDGFRKLAGLARRVIVDTAPFSHAKASLARLAELVGQGLSLGDLSWTRISRWRGMIAQTFENRERLARVPGEVRIRVRFGGKEAPATARYLGAWIAESLKAAGIQVTLTLSSDASAAQGELSGAELDGAGLRVELSSGNGRLRVKMEDGLEHCASHPPATDYLLMREELGIVGRDPVFERTLRAAAAL